jgi:hypothetical protein
MKLLFLDIDGVLVTDTHLVRSTTHMGLEFDPIAVETLEDVIRETDCKIVISSTWRRGRDTFELRNIFRPYSELIANAIIGKTDYYNENDQRQYEIKKFLQFFRTGKRQVESFVVIDDDVEFDLFELPENTVSTKHSNGLRGLTYDMKQKIVDILNQGVS